MAEERMIVMGIPLILLLAVLLLFGVTWLFHHHHWRPFAGVFLFVVGAGFFLLLMGRSARFAPQSIAPYDPRGMNSEVSTTSTGARFKTETVRQGAYGDRIVAERADPSSGTTKSSDAVRTAGSASSCSPVHDLANKGAERTPAL